VATMSARAKTSQTHSRTSQTHPRREQIVMAARAAIEEHGPEALTGRIAERAGLARPNVYRHFVSRDELYHAVARSAYDELQAKVLGRLDMSGTALELIRAPITAQVLWADQHPNLYRFLISRGYEQNVQQDEDERRDAVELAAAGASLLPHFTDDPEAASTVAVSLGGLVNASVLDWLSRRTETRKALINRLSLHAWLIIDHHLRDRGARIDPEVPLPRLKRTSS
jgi:AcrR family transcriptional regulator